MFVKLRWKLCIVISWKKIIVNPILTIPYFREKVFYHVSNYHKQAKGQMNANTQTKISHGLSPQTSIVITNHPPFSIHLRHLSNVCQITPANTINILFYPTHKPIPHNTTHQSSLAPPWRHMTLTFVLECAHQLSVAIGELNAPHTGTPPIISRPSMTSYDAYLCPWMRSSAVGRHQTAGRSTYGQPTNHLSSPQWTSYDAHLCPWMRSSAVGRHRRAERSAYRQPTNQLSPLHDVIWRSPLSLNALISCRSPSDSWTLRIQGTRSSAGSVEVIMGRGRGDAPETETGRGGKVNVCGGILK